MEAVKQIEITDLKEQVAVLNEQINAQEDMLKRTTQYLVSIQDKLASSKASLEHKNMEITESLRYAQRLQKALRPDVDSLTAYFTGGFVHLAQAQVIGGDLAYVRKTDDGFYVAAVDCTGHGIPGAMISMMAYGYLDEVILHRNVKETSDILSALNQLMYTALRDKGDDVKDGMDVALVRVCCNRKKLSFSGARRPLLFFSNGRPQVYGGSKHSIGESVNPQFDTQELDVKRGDKFYVFSDGLTDQFGGERDKKFGSKRIYHLMAEIKDLNMKKQAEILSDTLCSWQGDSEQTDDQVMIGVKI